LEEVVTGATGTSLFRVQMLLDDYLHIGRTDRALDKLSEELAKVERTGDHLGESELHRLRGEVVLAGDPSATPEAETSFRKAIEVARNQWAKWWELRATTGPRASSRIGESAMRHAGCLRKSTTGSPRASTPPT